MLCFQVSDQNFTSSRSGGQDSVTDLCMAEWTGKCVLACNVQVTTEPQDRHFMGPPELSICSETAHDKLSKSVFRFF